MSFRGLALYVCAACTAIPTAEPPARGLDGGVVVCEAGGSYVWRWRPCILDPAACVDQRPGVDDDGDGASELGGDCDDRDRFVARSAPEVCDLRDDDCDGEVDEDGVCDTAAAPSCPLSDAVVSCCGARHTLAGTFTAPRSSEAAGGWTGLDVPFAVVIRHRDSGELRRASVCAAPPATALGDPFRFVLTDPDFVRPDAEYEVLVHLRWFFPGAITPDSPCFPRAPVVRTSAITASVCFDHGPLFLGCL